VIRFQFLGLSGAGDAQHRQSMEGQGPGVAFPFHKDDLPGAVEAVQAVDRGTVTPMPAAARLGLCVGADPLGHGAAVTVPVGNDQARICFFDAPLPEPCLGKSLGRGQFRQSERIIVFS